MTLKLAKRYDVNTNIILPNPNDLNLGQNNYSRR